ncbi:DUF3811 domain-containing protein [Serratia marcescens]|uniref:DUF3811 domain-containing protein n=1 Tax=Serratia marcescens TaxID=615 RepID=A0A939NLM8_SERMA|nr:DUF3811 domain-containing protein [Serratia marcescens]
MTESEQREVKTELDKARKSHGGPLTNAEQHKVKDEVVTRIMAARRNSPRQSARNASQPHRPSGDTFSWSATIGSAQPSKPSAAAGIFIYSQTHPRYRIMNNNVINLL